MQSRQKNVSCPITTAHSTLIVIETSSISEHGCLWSPELRSFPQTLTISLFDKWADLSPNSSKQLLNFGNLPKLDKRNDPRRAINRAWMLAELPNLASVPSRVTTCTVVKGFLVINDGEVIIPLNPLQNLLIFIHSVMPERHLKILVTVQEHEVAAPSLMGRSVL